MKRANFSTMFLVAAFVIFLAAKRNALSSILLMLASAYEICGLIPKLRKEF